jgi:hypothetical protein
VGETRFADLRRGALEAALASLAPGMPGRPRKRELDDSARVAALERERNQLLFQARADEVRAYIGLVMPHLLLDRGGGKKATARSRRAARRASGARALDTKSGS